MEAEQKAAGEGRCEDPAPKAGAVIRMEAEAGGAPRRPQRERGASRPSLDMQRSRPREQDCAHTGGGEA